MSQQIPSAVFDTASEIIRTGMNKAADTLSFFMKVPVRLASDRIPLGTEFDSRQLHIREGSKTIVLTTDIIGDIPGICFLLFTEDEASELAAATFPADILKNEAAAAEMKHALLLEVDNIISASVVTQFANMLKCRMHGGVPKHQEIQNAELPHAVDLLIRERACVINFNTSFVIDGKNFRPQFIWAMDSAFLEFIRKYIDNVA
jgi:chemotaxis protein CheY-P-specific phosphatase CheC